ncbi:MAG: hypothetical protein R2825_12640 [Saprospiraceae bacterium]
MRGRIIACGVKLNGRFRQVGVGKVLSTTLNEQLALTVFVPSVTVSTTICTPTSLQLTIVGLVSVAVQLSVELPSPMLAEAFRCH